MHLFQLQHGLLSFSHQTDDHCVKIGCLLCSLTFLLPFNCFKFPNWVNILIICLCHLFCFRYNLRRAVLTEEQTGMWSERNWCVGLSSSVLSPCREPVKHTSEANNSGSIAELRAAGCKNELHSLAATAFHLYCVNTNLSFDGRKASVSHSRSVQRLLTPRISMMSHAIWI